MGRRCIERSFPTATEYLEDALIGLAILKGSLEVKLTMNTPVTENETESINNILDLVKCALRKSNFSSGSFHQG